MRLDRDSSGCIESIITWSKVLAYRYGSNDNEFKNNDEFIQDKFEQCKYKSIDIQLYQTKLNNCLDNPTISSYMI